MLRVCCSSIGPGSCSLRLCRSGSGGRSCLSSCRCCRCCRAQIHSHRLFFFWKQRGKAHWLLPSCGIHFSHCLSRCCHNRSAACGHTNGAYLLLRMLLCLLCPCQGPATADLVRQCAAVAVHGDDDVKIEEVEARLLAQALRQRLQKPGGRAGHAVALQQGGGWLGSADQLMRRMT